MGNSPGDLKRYWDLIWNHDCFFGACVWEFTDHAVNAGTPDAPRYRYGGDFGEKIHDGNFCVDGLVYPDRRIHSGLLEYRQILAPCVVSAFDSKSGQLTVKSRRYFTSCETHEKERIVLCAHMKIGADAQPLFAHLTVRYCFKPGKGVTVAHELSLKEKPKVTLPRMGLFEIPVSDHFEHYLKPQENMAHADTLWMELLDENGRGLHIYGTDETPLFSFNASHYTPMDLTKTAHDFELCERKETVVNIDFRQAGIGSNSCGPALAEEYSLLEREYRYAFTLLPLKERQ